MTDKAKQYLELFLVFFKLGAFTFGGGYAMIPLIRNEVVSKRNWVEDEEFMEMLALAQSAPGPISLNTALFIGNKRMGFKGGLVSGIALIIPSFVIILIIAMFLVRFKENAVVERVFKGIRPAVVALIAAPLYMLGKSANVNKKNIWIPIVVVALVAFLSVSPIYIIIGSIVLGLLHFLYIKKIHKR